MAERFIPLGKIVTTHGLDGWLKFEPYNPHTAALSQPVEILLVKDEIRSTHQLESSRPHQGQLLIKVAGINRIDEAERWVGSTLSIAEEALQPLGPGEYYLYQLIGLEVFDLRGTRIGVVARTLFTPAGELYVVTGESKEYLIPAVKEIVEKVDLDSGIVIINPPEGLLDL